MSSSTISKMKSNAAKFAVDFISSGMTVGLGSGSTAMLAVEEIAARIKQETLKDLICIPSSSHTKETALAIGLQVSGFDEATSLDINIDGADEIDSECNLIKGGGGALLKEKILAQNCRRNIVIVDESKISGKLGEKWHLPVEVLPFSWQAESVFLESLGAVVKLRTDDEDEPFVTDQENYILDCNFGIISQPGNLSYTLNQRAGIIEHGLFIDTTHDLVVGRAGKVDHRQIKS